MTLKEPAAPDATVRRRPGRLRALWLLAAVVVLAALMLASITVGARDVGWNDILAALGGSAEGFDEAAVAKRIPRTLLAVAAGAALGLSGAVMQGVTRNPLADPGILGINMGASLAIVAGMAFFGLAAASSYIWLAIAGAAVTAVFVYTVGSIGRGPATPLKLALAGAATSAALASFVSAVPSAATAPALVVVGVMMVSAFKDIKWDDLAEALPAFFASIFMGLCYSISYGIAAGFIVYCLVKVCMGKAKEIHPILWGCTGLFILNFVLLALL